MNEELDQPDRQPDEQATFESTERTSDAVAQPDAGLAEMYAAPGTRPRLRIEWGEDGLPLVIKLVFGED